MKIGGRKVGTGMVVDRGRRKDATIDDVKKSNTIGENPVVFCICAVIGFCGKRMVRHTTLPKEKLLKKLREMVRAATEQPQRLLADVVEAWLGAQTNLLEIFRWGWTQPGTHTRKQSVQSHTVGVQFLATSLMAEMDLPAGFDRHLLATCLFLHDCGEARVGAKYDIRAPDKLAHHDLEEYEIACAQWQTMPANTQQAFQRAFLLQFCLEAQLLFPEEEQETMRLLGARHNLEARLFQFVERYEYLACAMEDFVGGRFPKTDEALQICAFRLYEVSFRSGPKLQQWAQELGVPEAFWPLELWPALEAYIRDYERFHGRDGQRVLMPAFCRAEKK